MTPGASGGVSIRRRLLAGVACVQIVAAVLATVLVVRHEERRAYSLLEAQLVERAAMLEAVIEPPDNAVDKIILHRELLTLPRSDVYTLADTAGQIIAASSDWRMPGRLPAGPRSFVRLRIDGHRYRVLVLQDISLLNDDAASLARLPRLTLVYGTRVMEVEEQVGRVTWFAAGIGLALLLASLAATGWVVGAGLRPVVAMAGRASRIDATHWAWESQMGEAEELAPLSMALTRLVARLRTAFVRERQFSADAAHEMKTAVAIVKSTLQLTLERGGDATNYEAGIERALEDTERMQGLVSGMLKLAKIEGLGDAAGEGAADAIEVVYAVARRLEPVLAGRRMQLTIDAAAQSPSVAMPAEDLGLAVTNLLENAIHYSPVGSHITVTLRTDAAWCEVEVADSGVGIRADVLPHIFERFYRGDPSRARGSGGNGLGLAIVQALMQRAGGEVSAVSEVGVGSCFTVRVRCI